MRLLQQFSPRSIGIAAAVRSTMITALAPGLSVLGAVFFLGEPLYWNLAAGLVLVTLGIVFGVRSAGAPTTPPVASPAVATRLRG